MKKIWFHVVLVAVALIVSVILGYEARWAEDVEAWTPPEVADEQETPDRGFYRIHEFYIRDEMDCAALVADSFSWGNETPLVLLEINLLDYCDGEISEAGVRNVSALFDALRALDKRYIVRFVYDWDGENLEREPEKLSIILRHMEQLAGIVNRNRSCIFAMQGLFVGNWGEMNGTRHTGTSDWQTLAEKLAGAIDSSIYLSVRTPQQWRCINGTDEVPGERAQRGSLSARLGLFNDGMMASESDLGTYGDTTRAAGYDRQWTRSDELAFQDELCRLVPNGGEVLYDTEYNDFPQAVETLGTMHVTYLNREYDREALDKWEAYQISDGSIWDGMDGMTYIDRHLGYRYVLRGVSMDYSYWNNRLNISAEFANVGFAPAYQDMRVELVFLDKNGMDQAFRISGTDLRSLCGGSESGETLTVRGGVLLGEVERGDYEIYLRLYSDSYGRTIPLANEDYDERLGCSIGTLTAKPRIGR